MQDIGERLSSYEPLWENWYRESFIGGGSFGKVYKLRRDFYGETAYSAVKIIPIIVNDALKPKNVDTQTYIEQRRSAVVQEIKNMQKLAGYPYLVHCIADSIKDIRGDNGELVGFDVLIQMNYYTALADEMKRSGALDTAQVQKLAAQIAAALKAMHDINMLHRDVKVENIFIDENGDYLLGDFGVSKQGESSSCSTLAGTQPFIAPEVWNVQRTNRRYANTADIYSYGITLYYLLNDNMLPLTEGSFTENQVNDAIFARLNGKAFPPPKNGSALLKEIVMKCCAYRPEDRFQDAGEIIEAFKNGKVESRCQPKIAPKPAVKDAYATVYAGEGEEPQRAQQKNRPQSVSPVSPVINRRPPARPQQRPPQYRHGNANDPNPSGRYPTGQRPAPRQYGSYRPNNSYRPNGQYGTYPPRGTYRPAPAPAPKKQKRSPFAVLSVMITIFTVAITVLLVLYVLNMEDGEGGAQAKLYEYTYDINEGSFEDGEDGYEPYYLLQTEARENGFAADNR